jgi:hypothetical protein
MRHNNLKGYKPFIIFITLVFLLLSSTESLAGTSVEDIQKYFATQIAFEDLDLANLKNGEMVAKLLPARDKREVAVFGIIPIKTSPDAGFTAFQETMSRQNKKSVIESGSFGIIPTIEDLKNLTLEKGDIEDLRQCRVGSCKVKLSGAMIERFQKEIDWNAPDYPAQTNILFRQIILDYVRDYVAQGNSALIEYNDQSEAISLQKENSSLLQNLTSINELAPEFSQYLANPSRPEPSNLKKSISWTKIKFGLKPVIIITQTVTYTRESNANPSQILSVSKQLYASHYFDSSITLTALIKPLQTDPIPDSYLLYTNYSRSSSLDGLLSKVKHQIVEGEALMKLKALLQDTKYYTEAKPTNQNISPESSVIETEIARVPNLKYSFLLILAFAIIVLYTFIKQFVNKKHLIKKNILTNPEPIKNLRLDPRK